MSRISTLTILIYSFLCIHSISIGQQSTSSGQIYHKIKKLGVLANVMYFAAHPDDENTRMISYLSNDIKADTRYVSLTRGDGGQNLIGSELKELLGVIRTQELLEARKIDGGSQRFSRAYDFGYSKNAEETIEIWDKDKVLSDAVWAFREFRPDIIINRFDHRTSGKSHGHHTASAIIALEAFTLASDPKAYSEQLKHAQIWNPRRIFFNTSWWFYGGRDKFAKADKSNLVAMDVGSFYPLLGMSNNEMAAYSRSMHKCQGMGSTPRRGTHMEYLELLGGDMPKDKSSIFDGMDISWTRLDAGSKILPLYNDLVKDYDFIHPEKSVPILLRLRRLIADIEDPFWKKKKLAEIDDILKDCLGLFMESKIDRYVLTPGEKVEVETEVVSLLSDEVKLTGLSILPMRKDTSMDIKLDKNVNLFLSHDVVLPDDIAKTTPYYLRKKETKGMFTVDDQRLRGVPTSPSEFKVVYTIEIGGQNISYTRDVINKYTHQEHGEVYRPVTIVEPLYLDVDSKVMVFPDDKKQEVVVTLTAYDDISGKLTLGTKDNWSTTAGQNLSLKKGEKKTVRFELSPPKGEDQTTLFPIFIDTEGNSYDKSLTKIEYPHIPTQFVALPLEIQAAKFNLKKGNERILYIEGAGDEIASNLRQIGYDLKSIPAQNIATETLSDYDVVILGIRAYNKWESLIKDQEHLHAYVKEGGTLIVQYNRNRGVKVDNIGPYPIKLSRDRVSVEEAEIRILDPSHPLVTYPNPIKNSDFDGWVQERGLNFANEWDSAYSTLFSSNDPGESPKEGGLLIADYGKGKFIYTGYSWFRQLPAGVPGAFKLFVNMISYNNKQLKR